MAAVRLPPSVRDLPREVWVLAAVAFAVAIGFGIVAPAIPLFAKTFGVGNFAAAAVVSVFAFMRLVTAPAGGRIVDRLGERSVMATGVGIVAVSSALAGLAQTYTQLLVLRGAGGFGSALFTISAATLLLRSVRADQRGRASGMFSAGFLIGGISGPALGGVVVQWWGLRAPFFLYAGTLVGAVAIALVQLRRTELAAKEAERQAAARTSVLHLLRTQQAYRAALTTHFADTWAVLGVRLALVPLFVQDVLQRDPMWVGIGLAVVAAVNGALLLPAGKWSDAMGRKPVLLTGCTLAGTGIVVLALVTNLPGYLVAMVLLGAGSGFLNVAPGAMAGDLAGQRGGSVIAVYQMAGDLGMIVGPLLVGWLADEYSFSVGFLATAGAFLLAIVMTLFAQETHKRVTDEPAEPLPEEVPERYGG